MTNSYTTTETFTLTNAKYLASKVAADLLQMQLFYGRPINEEINQYLEEIVILLLEGCLGSVSYGYKKDGKWLVVLNYSATFGSLYSTDDRSGCVAPGVDVGGADWSSYLWKNSKFSNLPQVEKDRIEQSLPFQRTESAESGFHNGTWVSGKNYFSGGASLERKIFKPY